MKDFSDHILQILKTNGFPAKRVSLPTDKLFEAAEKKGFSFNQVLQLLKTDHGVEAEIGAEKIIFSQTRHEQVNVQDMMKEAQDMIAKMDPEEIKKLQEMFQNMSPEQKEEILKKGKDLGIL